MRNVRERELLPSYQKAEVWYTGADFIQECTVVTSYECADIMLIRFVRQVTHRQSPTPAAPKIKR